MKPLTIPKGSLIRVCAIAAVTVLIAAGAAGVLFAKSTTWTQALLPVNDLWSNADELEQRRSRDISTTCTSARSTERAGWILPLANDSTNWT